MIFSDLLLLLPAGLFPSNISIKIPFHDLPVEAYILAHLNLLNLIILTTPDHLYEPRTFVTYNSLIIHILFPLKIL
jgi:hypothetical protein